MNGVCALDNYAQTAGVNQVSPRSMIGTHSGPASEGLLPSFHPEVGCGRRGWPAEAAVALAICAGLTVFGAPLAAQGLWGSRELAVVGKAGCGKGWGPLSDSVAECQVWLVRACFTTC